MAAHQKMALRVVLIEVDIRNVILNTRPATVEDMTSQLKETLGLHYNFSLQYKDSDFSFELCNFSNTDKITIKVIPVLELVPVSTSDATLNKISSTIDTEILSTSSQERQKPWPDIFDIPNFSVHIEYRLRQADLLYLHDCTLLKLSKELKHEILERLAESIYSYRAYPNNSQFESVAAALINKHPRLKEHGSASRCSGWKNSLKYKMANYRTKRRRSECLDVVVNAGQWGGHSTEGEPVNKMIKKAKKGKLNYLPNFPEGFEHVAFEAARKDLVHEMQKEYTKWTTGATEDGPDIFTEKKRSGRVSSAISNMVECWHALTEDQTTEPTDTQKLVLRVLLSLATTPQTFTNQALTLMTHSATLTLGKLLIEHETAVSSFLHLKVSLLSGIQKKCFRTCYIRIATRQYDAVFAHVLVIRFIAAVMISVFNLSSG